METTQSRQVTCDNWTHCGYKSLQLQALITIGAHPTQGTAEPALVYYLTLLDTDFKEVFQQEFSTLEQAISSLNDRYGHWEFTDREKSTEGSGCGSCEAH